MLRLSRNDLESISRKYLSYYLKLVGERLDRIDPTDFAEKVCGIRFEFAELNPNGRVLGITSFGDVEINITCKDGETRSFKLDGKTAYIDKKLLEEGHVGRLNFTMMHEIAHQLLGMLYPDEYNMRSQPVIFRLVDERMRHPITNWPEWQTNVLTSCLLLPRELLDKKMQEFGLGKKIWMLNRVYAKHDYSLFSEMADQLGVSKTALSIRLNQLGLIEKNHFYDPYSPLEIYADEDEIN